MTEAQIDAAMRHMEGSKPKYHKGVYGKKFDHHTCGACGFTIAVIYEYCPNCGTRILWGSPRCLTGEKEEQNG